MSMTTLLLRNSTGASNHHPARRPAALVLSVALLVSLSGVAAAAETAETPPDSVPADGSAATPERPDATTAPASEPAADEQVAPAAEASADPSLGGSLVEATPGDALSSIELAIQAKEIDSAKAELNAYIEQIEAATHRYSPELVRPLVVLGDAHMAAGEFEEASDTYGRAVHIDRVANGLHSASQANIVYKEADALAALGDLAAANDRELYAYEVQLREHEPDSMDMLPATFRIGDWHLKTHNVLLARAAYKQAERTLNKAGQLEGEPAIRALRGVATTYRLERFPPVYQRPNDEPLEGGTTLPTRPYDDNSPFNEDAVVYVNNFPQGEKALNRLANMLLEDPAASALDKAQALTDLADWYLLFDRQERATPLYVEARRILVEAGLPQADRFAAPEVLYFPEPPPLKAPAPDDREEMRLGRVKVGFTVTPTGDVNELVTLEVEPESNMEYRVRRSMRVARYRPPLVEDQLAAATGQTFLYEYKYYPRKVSAPPPEPALKAANKTPGGSADAKRGSTTGNGPGTDPDRKGDTGERSREAG